RGIAMVELIERASACRRRRRVAAQRGAPRADAPLPRLGLLRDGEEAATVARLVDRERMKGFPMAAVDERRQRDVEEALELGAHEIAGALVAELEERVAVDRGDRAGEIERDDPFAPGPDELRPAVEPHHEGVAEAVQEQPVLDHLRRHVHEHEGVLLRAVRLAGGVQNRDELAAMIEHWSRAAGQPGIASEEVVLAVDDDGCLLEQTGSHAVRAAVPFAPYCTWDE